MTLSRTACFLQTKNINALHCGLSIQRHHEVLGCEQKSSEVHNLPTNVTIENDGVADMYKYAKRVNLRTS